MPNLAKYLCEGKETGGRSIIASLDLRASQTANVEEIPCTSQQTQIKHPTMQSEVNTTHTNEKTKIVNCDDDSVEQIKKNVYINRILLRISFEYKSYYTYSRN